MYTSKKYMAKKVTQIQNNGAPKDTKKQGIQIQRKWGIQI